MNDWCSSALYKKFLIKKLNEDFAIKVENSNNKNYQSKKIQKSRRARNKDDDESVEKDDTNTISTNNGSDPNVTKEIRISLNKSRRVITEN